MQIRYCAIYQCMDRDLLVIARICMPLFYAQVGYVPFQPVHLKQTAVTRKRDSRQARALDAENNTVQIKDIVNVIDGPHSVSR